MNLKVTIDRFDGDTAIIKTSDGDIISWPKNKLPEGTGAGAILNFNILDDTASKQDKKETAKAILNEILNTEE